MAERKAEIDRWIGKMSRRGDDKRKGQGREDSILLLDVPNGHKNTTHVTACHQARTVLQWHTSSTSTKLTSTFK